MEPTTTLTPSEVLAVKQAYCMRTIRVGDRELACGTKAVGFCDHCDEPFCSDHGSIGGGMRFGEGGTVAVPSRCWVHGGFDAEG